MANKFSIVITVFENGDYAVNLGSIDDHKRVVG
jgi:hypothetical protein